MKSLLTILFTCLFIGCNGQLETAIFKSLPDSLNPRQYPPTPAEIIRLFRSAYVIPKDELPKAEKMALSLKEWLQKSGLSNLEKANGLFALANFYQKNQDEDSLILYCSSVLALCDADSVVKKAFYSGAVVMKGLTLLNSRNYTGEISFYEGVIDELYSLKDTVAVGWVYLNLSVAYYMLENPTQAIEDDRIAMSMLEKTMPENQKRQLYLPYTNMAYYMLQQYFYHPDKALLDSALLYKQTALQKRGTDTLSVMEDYYKHLIIIAYYKGDYSKVLNYLDRASTDKYVKADEYYYDSDSRDLKKIFACLTLLKLDREEEALALVGYHYTPNPETSTIFAQLFYSEMAAYFERKGKTEDALFYNKKLLACIETLRAKQYEGIVFEDGLALSRLKKQANLTAGNAHILLQKQKKQYGYIITTCIMGILILILIVLFLYFKQEQQSYRQKLESQRLLAALDQLERDMAEERERELLKKGELVAEERKQIARDIHDRVSSELTVFKYRLAEKAKTAGDENTKEMLEELALDAQSLYTEARVFINRLSTDRQDKYNYNVNELLSNLTKRFDDEAILKITAITDYAKIEKYLTKVQHHELYLVIKEAVTNAIKHAKAATKAQISIECIEDRFYFMIKDNGGATGSAKLNETGVGLKSMKERIDKIGGTISFVQNHDGMVVSGSFPVDEQLLQRSSPGTPGWWVVSGGTPLAEQPILTFTSERFKKVS